MPLTNILEREFPELIFDLAYSTGTEQFHLVAVKSNRYSNTQDPQKEDYYFNQSEAKDTPTIIANIKKDFGYEK